LVTLEAKDVIPIVNYCIAIKIIRNVESNSKGSYINCSDKEPEEVKPKDQGFDEAAEKIVDTSNTVSGTGGLDISFGNIFQSKFKIILIVIIIIVVVSISVAILIIFLYCYCNRTKVAVAVASVSSL
jgi:hypothetical protein